MKFSRTEPIRSTSENFGGIGNVSRIQYNTLLSSCTLHVEVTIADAYLARAPKVCFKCSRRTRLAKNKAASCTMAARKRGVIIDRILYYCAVDNRSCVTCCSKPWQHTEIWLQQIRPGDRLWRFTWSFITTLCSGSDFRVKMALSQMWDDSCTGFLPMCGHVGNSEMRPHKHLI